MITLPSTIAPSSTTTLDDSTELRTEAAGYHREMLRVVSDSWGRPTYEVYRFVR